MYLHLELRGKDAGELAYVLGKHPDRVFEWEVMGSLVRVFFPVVEAECSRVVVLFWPDLKAPFRRPGKNSSADEGVTPRPYCFNSVFCVALKTVFNSTISGQRQAPPEVLEREHDFELVMSPLCSYLSPDRIAALFTPLGYEATLTESGSLPIDLALRHPRVFECTLRGRQKVAELLRQIIILALVIDSDRHEYMGQADIDRLRRFGAGWLENHPERTLIISRYLIYRRLIDQFLQASHSKEELSEGERHDDGYDSSSEPIPLRQPNDQERFQGVLDAIKSLSIQPNRILNLQCGEGRLLAELVSRGSFGEVLGLDVSAEVLERARRRIERAIRYANALRNHPTRYELRTGAAGYADPGLVGYDCILIGDGVTHPSIERLRFLVPTLLDHWTPRHVVLMADERELGEREGRADRADAERFRRAVGDLVRGRPYRLEPRNGQESVERHGLQLVVVSRVGGGQ